MPVNQRSISWIWFPALLIILSAMGSIGYAKAQENTKILCGEQYFYSLATPIPGFVGQYFYIAEWGQDDSDRRELGIITAQGEQRIPVTLPAAITRNVGGPFVSPDGSRIAFPPFSLRSRDFVIWDRNTNEIAQIELSQELADYLSDNDDNPDLAIVNFEQVVWHDSSELWVQYFGLYPDIDYPLLRITLTVLDKPLRVVPQGDVTAISLETIQSRTAPLLQSSAPSPRDAYRFEVEELGQGLHTRQFRIYDTATDQLVFSVDSSEQTRIVGDPMWSSDQNHIFYSEVVPSGMKIVQLNGKEDFQRNTHLDALLESQFGTSTGVMTTFPPMLSKDGTHIGFGYLNQGTDEYYMLRYHPSSGALVAVCDEFPSSSDWYPFWSPSNRFAGYWYNGLVKIYDFETGNRYLLPGQGFAGWIP